MNRRMLSQSITSAALGFNLLLGGAPRAAQAAELPDLKASYQGSEIAGSTKYAVFEVKNVGSAAAGGSRAKGVRDNELTHPQFFNLPSLGAGSSTTVKVAYGAQSCGTFHFKLTLDVDGSVAESHEDNNLLDVPADACPPPAASNPIPLIAIDLSAPDLATTYMYPLVFPDHLVLVFQVKNIGNATAKDVDAVASTTVYDAQFGETIGSTQYGLAKSSTLAPGASFLTTVECPTTPAKTCQQVTLSAKTSGDSNLTNNSASWKK